MVGVHNLLRGELLSFTNRTEFGGEVLAKILLEGIVESVAYYSHMGFTVIKFIVRGPALVLREAIACGLGRLG